MCIVYLYFSLLLKNMFSLTDQSSTLDEEDTEEDDREDDEGQDE